MVVDTTSLSNCIPILKMNNIFTEYKMFKKGDL